MANDEQFKKCVIGTPMFFPIDGWEPYRLPELASNGLPFSPTFILPKSANSLGATPTSTGSAQPFGFHYRQQHAIRNRPVIDLTKGYYDPYTQVYTIPLQAGGDTDGGVIPTGYWTDTTDGNTQMKEWDTMDDQVTD
ncbi:MAG: hypothetical protein JO202_17645 [Ktedonobacteraceae bacterium]|nr:hypothetical protein [Ktedonobacteraceae bacterium]